MSIATVLGPEQVLLWPPLRAPSSVGSSRYYPKRDDEGRKGSIIFAIKMKALLYRRGEGGKDTRYVTPDLSYYCAGARE